MSARSLHATEKLRTECPSPARMDETESGSSQQSGSSTHWDFENCIISESVNCKRRLRSSSWDDSDDDLSPELPNYHLERLQSSKASASAEINELKKQFFEQTKNWESDRRQSPARVRRRTKSSSSSSPVSDSKSPTKGISESSPKNAGIDAQFFLDNFFSELRTKRISLNDSVVEEQLGDENKVSLNQTSRKLSQILEVEESKKDLDENISLFSRKFREAARSSPIPTAEYRKSEKLPELNQNKYHSLSFEEFGSFIKLQQLPGSFSERNSIKLGADSIDFITLSAKAGKTQLSDCSPENRITTTNLLRSNRSEKSSPRFPLSIEKDSARSLRLEEINSPDSIGKNLPFEDLKLSSSSEASLSKTESPKSGLKTERKLPIVIQSPSLKSVESSIESFRKQSSKSGRMSRRSNRQRENSNEEELVQREVEFLENKSEKPESSTFRTDVSMKTTRNEISGSNNKNISKPEEKKRKTSRPESKKSNRSTKSTPSDRSRISKTSSSVSRSRDSLEESDDSGKLTMTWKEMELNHEPIVSGWNAKTRTEPRKESTERPEGSNSKKSESLRLKEILDAEGNKRENGETLSVINEMSFENIHSSESPTSQGKKKRRTRGSANANAEEKLEGNSSDSGKWNELIRKFCGNSNSVKFETNFPGFPIPVETSWESKKTFDLDEENDKGESSVSQSQMEEDEKITQLNSVSKENLAEKLAKEKELVNLRNSQNLFYFHVNFPTGEGGDVSCWNLGKSDAPDSNRPQDHGDGNQSEIKNLPLPDKNKEKKPKRLLWTEVNSKSVDTSVTNSEGSEFDYETTPRLSRSCDDLKEMKAFERSSICSNEREEKSNNWLSLAGNLEKRKKKKKDLRKNESENSIPQLKLKNSTCFYNFYKRFIRVFCLTSNSSASSSK